MVSLLLAVTISASVSRAKLTLTESRFKPEYFTRNRKMPFEKLLHFLISMYKTSSQAALNKFFESKGISLKKIIPINSAKRAQRTKPPDSS